VETYSAVLVVDVAEAAAGSFDLLDEPVEAFGLGVGVHRRVRLMQLIDLVRCGSG